ncbi:MAG: sulfatase [bacterium]|jgi:arylsulfatase A-like enzyme|nr:sulfatase [bacterium]
MIDRRTFLQCLAPAALLATSRQPQAGRRRNIILITVDDLGWSDLPSYGGDFHETPHLDRLAREGLRFTDAYASSPVCTPTRASILTGLHPARLHMTIWREAALNPPPPRALQPPPAVADLPLSHVTIAEQLRQAGYHTAHIGKWHVGGAAYYPETQGFDLNIGGTIWGAPPTYFAPYRGGRNPEQELRYIPGVPFAKPGEYLTDRLTDEAIRFMQSAADFPFFLNLAYYTVHTPMEGKPEYKQEFETKRDPAFHHQNVDYAAMLRSLDENVGRLRAALQALGLEQDTAVLFVSDNGGYINRYKGQRVTSNYPLRSGKGSLYEGGIRVPLLMHVPGLTQPGTVCHEPVISMDLYPTILALAGINTSPCDGHDLVPLLRDPSSSLPRPCMTWHYPHYYPTWDVPEDEHITAPVSAIREGKWKLIHHYETQQNQLFDLEAGLGEELDCAGQYPDHTARLWAHLRQSLEAMAARLPTRPAETASDSGE